LVFLLEFIVLEIGRELAIPALGPIARKGVSYDRAATTPDGVEPGQMLRELALKGIRQRYGDPIPAEAMERLENASALNKQNPEFHRQLWVALESMQMRGRRTTAHMAQRTEPITNEAA